MSTDKAPNPKWEEYKAQQQAKIQHLKDKYPELLQKIEYFSCESGWYDLIDRLCDSIQDHIKYLPMEISGEMRVAQVKEKFGGLRFHMDETTPYIDGAISFAESMSYIICELCGAPGKVRKGGWIRTLCDHCEEENKTKKR